MGVDLNRLREAMTHGMQERDRRETLAGVGAAVLEAELVWWCFTSDRADPDRCYGRVAEFHRLCGPAVVLPIAEMP